MKTVLVTGGAGFIGSNFLLYLAEKYPSYRLLNLDKLTYAGNLENLKAIEKRENYRFIRGDIADSAVVGKVFAGEEIDWVVNFAAESHVDRSILMPALFVRTNIVGTANLLNAALTRWEGAWEEKRFLQISTDEVYGSLGETGFFTETTPLDPHTPYAASKAGADLLVKAYHDTYGLPVIISRCTNNYGPYQFPEKLIPLVINNALHRKKLPVYGDGRQIRDWLYVEDHCKALDLILHKGKPGEVYNIGGHNERTNLVVVKTIIGYLREHVDPGITEDLIAFVPDRKGHDFRYGIDPAKICNELGWRPETPFAEGIVRTIRWYLENRDWLARVTAGEYQEYYRRVYEER
ncbi:MAG: dTDP-glucose 4,6-dehydratase [Firmicutes bacterium]|jgi:dTDP-glucose 4,6-dehydratase|nr:dTDP-glucose 4,6-dehydratase [Bacillota bacterium]